MNAILKKRQTITLAVNFLALYPVPRLAHTLRLQRNYVECRL